MPRKRYHEPTPLEEEMHTLQVWHFPVRLHKRLKRHCARRKISIRAAVIELTERFIRGEV